ncbi:IMPACT family protein [Flavobacterium sp.]|uniref:IMPACT family protein n=1 Tax=Flavobacterium sp. TaxID=239 RepID=UPI0037BE8174
MKMEDTYKTITFPSSEILFKEKNSKFFGYSFPIQSETEVKPLIDQLRKQHPNAVHFCYAYQIGSEKIVYRANDDGEPSSTAGMPIYGQIQSFAVTNILVVIVRIYGGVKLGVGGLISAYRTAAQMTLESAEIIEKSINIHFLISFDYKNINKVMRVIKEKDAEILSQKMEMSCEIEICSRKKNAEILFNQFDTMFEVEIKRLK